MGNGMRFILVVLSTSGLIATAVAGEYNVKPGMWESTAKIEVTGMPPELAAMMKHDDTVDKECIKDNKYDFKKDLEGCEVTTVKENKNVASYKVKCDKEHGNSTGNIEFHYNGDKVSGTIEMNVQQGPAGPMMMKTIISGRRVGSC